MTDAEFRIAELLATRRPAPSEKYSSPWSQRHDALYRALKMTSRPDLQGAIRDEIDAMNADRDQLWERKRALERDGEKSMETCPLRPVHRGPGTCDGCAGELPVGRRRWCSDECANRWWANHAWTSARWLAVARSSGFTIEQLRELREAAYSMAFCDECGQYTSAPEVNHVDPRVGRGYGPGCHNHQTNLVVLCHDCHVAETNRQRADRIAGVVWLVADELEAVDRPAPLAPPTTIVVAVEYGETLGIPSAGAWDIAS